MERRFRVRLEELRSDAEVSPTLLRGVLPQLETFLAPFLSAMTIPEQRTNARHYVAGLLSDLPSKDAESIAYLHDRERQGLQKFVGQMAWDQRPLVLELARQVGAELGAPDGVLVFDPSAFPKKGTESVGVQRQWCGRLGQGRELSGRHLLGVRVAPRTRAGRCSALPAQGVGEAPTTAAEGRRAGGDAVPDAARTGAGDARRAGPAAAACVGHGRRRNGPVRLVSPGIAGPQRVVRAGRAEQYLGARSGRRGAALSRSRSASPQSLSPRRSAVRRRAG
jgi:hypothetical protein